MANQLVLDALAAEAERWVGTPFHHQAAVCNVGCDCVGLLRGVLEQVTGEKLPFRMDYAGQAPANWQAPVIEPHLAAVCERRGPAGLTPGVVLLFQPLDGRELAVHVGIMTEPKHFVHAWWPRRRVIRTRLTGCFSDQLHSAWAWKGEPSPQ